MTTIPSLTRIARTPLKALAYGLAFLLLKRGDNPKAIDHLQAFLARPPKGPDADRWVKHAEETLTELGAAGESTPTEA